MIHSNSHTTVTTSNDPFSDLLWEENQHQERLEAKRRSSSTLSADIEAYLGSTH